MEKLFREFRKHKEWGIRGKDQPAAEKISYRQMLEYCEVIYYM